MIDSKIKILTVGLVALTLTSCTVPKTFMSGFDNIPFPENKNKYLPATKTGTPKNYSPTYDGQNIKPSPDNKY